MYCANKDDLIMSVEMRWSEVSYDRQEVQLLTVQTVGYLLMRCW